MSLQPSALSGVEHAPADLFEHTTRLRCSPPRNSGRASLSLRLDVHGDAYLAFSFVLALLTPRRSRAQASTPTLLAPCVVVRSSPPDRTAAPTLYLALRAPPRCSPDPSMTHLLRGASRSRTSVPAAATAPTPALATCCHSCADAVVEPLPHGEAAFLPSAPHVHIVSPVCRGYITTPARSPFVVVLLTSASLFASNTSASAPAPPASNPLQRRTHLRERAASRSFTTAESSTRNGEVEDDDDEFELGSAGEGDNAQSPPPSFEAGTGGRRTRRIQIQMKSTTTIRPPRPPSPVLLALAPPIGNWFTGGDHVKDLLLVFYLQIIEVPWSLYHAARPRRPPAPRETNPDPPTSPALRARRAARAQSALHSLELGFLCLVTSFLGVALLRSLASLSSPSSSSQPRPSSRARARSTLKSTRTLRVLPRPETRTADAESAQAQLAALRTQVARLELAVAQLAAPDREDTLYVYVEDALAPLEKGVRRVERRVGRLRAGRKELEGASQSHLSSAAGRRSRSSARGSAGLPLPPHTTYVPPPLSPTNTNGNGAGKRRALDSIPEEEGGDGAMHVLPHPRHTHPAYTPAHADVDAGAGGTLLPLLRAWLAACVALAVYPLYAVLKPVRGAGLGVGETSRILPYSPCAALRLRLSFVYHLSSSVPFFFIVPPSFSGPGPEFISHRPYRIIVRIASSSVFV
ncbi:hypothetical protein B0H14DRAFT_3505348 [Mycena olivaceomarginata]|nr:hypothetical protein B0H14DRAFT_3505348 [Mycena olivaceomarginata]